MASIYSDDARLVRYEKLRKRKDITEKVRGVAMLIALILAAGEIVPSFFESLVGGAALLRDLSCFFAAIFSAVGMAAAIYAIYKRDWRITLIVLLALGALCGIGVIRYWGFLQPFPLAVSLFCDFVWAKLKNEEGFPQFQLEIDRHTATEMAWDYTARKKAVESGARIAATGTASDSDMHDLLDESAEVINTDLKGYQERSEGADPLVHKAEAKSDIMDSLEEF